MLSIAQGTKNVPTVATKSTSTDQGVFDTAPSPSTGPDDDPQHLGQSLKKLFLNTWVTYAFCPTM